jgi:hypothetical protein
MTFLIGNTGALPTASLGDGPARTLLHAVMEDNYA